MNIKTRFAPSPTGRLHVGNARTAITNFLFSLKHNGMFILRIDDTDIVRSKKEYEDSIIEDLLWLGIKWDEIYHQSKRLDKYDNAKEYLIKTGRLYECFETAEELEIKRKILLSSGKPPIYDRASLKLSDVQKQEYIEKGRKPHYRFLLNENQIYWNDIVKGDLRYDPSNLSDPIVIREDGTMTYMICSTIDDIEFGITHVLRGEDHVSNTAIQIQMFDAFGASSPVFAHLNLLKAKDEKISKRVGGFEISSLREDLGIEPMTICSFFAKIGSSESVSIDKNMAILAKDFDVSKFSKSASTYVPEELERLNHKFIISLEYDEVKERLKQIDASYVTEDFWNKVKQNLVFLKDIKLWWDICNNFTIEKIDILDEDKEVLKTALDFLPEEEFTENTWKIWTDKISEKTKRKGFKLYMPLRMAITKLSHGPELKYLLPLIGKSEVKKRINYIIN